MRGKELANGKVFYDVAPQLPFEFAGWVHPKIPTVELIESYFTANAKAEAFQDDRWQKLPYDEVARDLVWRLAHPVLGEYVTAAPDQQLHAVFVASTRGRVERRLLLGIGGVRTDALREAVLDLRGVGARACVGTRRCMEVAGEH